MPPFAESVPSPDRTAPASTVARHRPCPEWTTRSEAFRHVCHGRTARAAAPIAAVVGALLSAVNDGTAIIDGRLGWVTWTRVAVNFATPFLVASLGYLASGRT